MLLTEDATLPPEKGIVNPKHAISIVNGDIGWSEPFDPRLQQKLKESVKRKMSHKHRRISGNVELITASSTEVLDDAQKPKTPKSRNHVNVVLRDINLTVEKVR